MDRVRLANTATGGLTEAEFEKLASHHAIWATRAARTEPLSREVIEPLIRDLYVAASLNAPTISVVSSPGVMAFVGIFAKHILRKKSQAPEYPVTLPDDISFACEDKYKPIVKEVINTLSNIINKSQNISSTEKQLNVPNLTLWATYGAIDIPIADALDQKTDADIRGRFEHYPLRDMDNAVMEAMKDPFGNSTLTPLMQANVDAWGLKLANTILPHEEDAVAAINDVCDWWTHSQRGTADTYWVYYLTAARDILELQVPDYEKFKIWEECTIHSAYRFMDTDFCLVCDFPSKIESKNLNYVNGTGTNNYFWRDGWFV